MSSESEIQFQLSYTSFCPPKMDLSHSPNSTPPTNTLKRRKAFPDNETQNSAHCTLSGQVPDTTDQLQVSGTTSTKCAHDILQEQRLRDLFNFDVITRVNPDKEVQRSGQFEVYNASETPSAIHSPQGAFLGSMHTERTMTLLQADQNTSSQPDDFLQVIAKLIVRYKDGCESGSHSIPYKHCYTTPLSLTIARISAVGKSTEIIRLATQLYSRHEALLFPFCRACRVWCSPGCFFVHLTGQKPPRMLRCSDAKAFVTLLHASAFRVSLCLLHCCCQIVDRPQLPLQRQEFLLVVVQLHRPVCSLVCRPTDSGLHS